MPEIHIGSRGSALARWQTDWVAARLQHAWPDLTCQIEYFSTSGDRITDRPLPEIGGKVDLAQTERRAQVAEVMTRARQMAAELRNLPRQELFARFRATLDEMRTQAIAQDTAGDGVPEGD